MAKKPVTVINNSGGFATDLKEGIINSFAFFKTPRFSQESYSKFYPT